MHHWKVLLITKLSFEWSHRRISNTDLKVRTNLYSIINSTFEKDCSLTLI